MTLDDLQHLSDIGVSLAMVAEGAGVPYSGLRSRLKRRRDGQSARELDADEAARIAAALRAIRDDIDRVIT